MPRRADRPPVIGDVAKLAGVSVPTVSRVLTGSTPVTEKTRRRVESAIEELGYRPNGAARALVAGRQPIVGIITSDTTRYGYASTIQGIEEGARAAGLMVAITVVSSDAAESTAAAVDVMLGQPVVGVIVLEFDTRGAAVLRLLPRSLPVVSVRSVVDDSSLPAVLFDDHAGGLEATRYLLQLGHRTVHHVAVPSNGAPSGRSTGWADALRQAGIVPPAKIEADWTTESGYQAGAELAQRPEVTAIFCGNDEVAFGVMKALADAGRQVPEDVSVIGFDDHPLASFWSPALTTIGQDFVALGAVALERLLLEGRERTEITTRVSSPGLVERSSAGPPG